MNLGVNIDHIAYLRENRKINDPDPLEAIYIAKRAGASLITIHLREDRRHIDDFDLRRVIESSFLPVNVECSIDDEITDLICFLKPLRATIVPEKREEVTTEGGLDIFNPKVKDAITKLKNSDIEVSLFVDPKAEIALECQSHGADMIELHTGTYANLHLMLYSNLSRTKHSIKEMEVSRDELKDRLKSSLDAIKDTAKEADEVGLKVAAGHGLNYINAKEIAKIDKIIELNIGQSIIARAVYVGLEKAIKDMVDLID